LIISRILQRKGFLKWISTYSGKLNLEDGFSEKYNYLQFLKMSSVAMQVAAARHAQDEIRVRFQRLRASAVRLASFLSVAWQIIHKGKRQSPRARVIFVLVFFFLFSDGVTRDTPAIVLVPQLVDLAGLEINHGMFVKLAAMYDPKTMTRGRTKLHFFSQAVTTARNFICQTLRNDPSSRWQAIVPAVEALGVESCIDHRLLTSRARALLSEHS